MALSGSSSLSLLMRVGKQKVIKSMKSIHFYLWLASGAGRTTFAKTP